MLRKELSVLVAVFALCGCLGNRSGSGEPTLESADTATSKRPARRDPRLDLPIGHSERRQAELAAAERDYRRDPDSETAAIWYGRRLGYVGRFEEAIAIYSAGLRRHPKSARLLRHRGHRWISLREFQRAEEDLRRAVLWSAGTADQIEADGIPNAAARPRSTTQGNIWYHLALAHFLQGEFDAASRAWRTCLGLSANDDTLVAISHWYFMTLRHLGRDSLANALLGAIHEDMEILENHSYHAVLLLKKDRRQVEELLNVDDPLAAASAGFGVAHWYLMNGDHDSARKLLQTLCAAPPSAAFGRIAAEVELRRMDEVPASSAS